MKILLINHYAGSPLHGMAFRPHLMARAWKRLGYETRVIAASYSHLRSRQPVLERPLQLELVEGIEYCWLATPPYAGNGFGRVRNMLAFLRGLYRHAADITDGFSPDVVITSSTYPLDVIPARRLARSHDAFLVHELHDLWPLSPMELGGMSRWHPFIMGMQFGENFAYRNADRVVSMLPKTEPHMRQHGLAPGKWVYVPNGVDQDEWAVQEPLPTRAREGIEALRSRYPVLIGYAGAHGLANALGTLPEVASQLASAGAAFVLVGQGPEKPRLQAMAAERRLENVLFLDVIPKRAVSSFLEAMDGLYISFARRRLYQYGISPNKIMDYMMAARPIVCAIQEDVGNDLVADAGAGFSTPPEDPAAIAAAIRRLIAATPIQRAEMGQRGKAYVLRHHSYDVLAERFLAGLTTRGGKLAA